MTLGTALLCFCTALTVIAVVVYILSAFDKKQLPIARMVYYAMTTGVIMTSAYLMVLIFKHDFSAQYVFSYTSRDLKPIYLVSAFWAGQEGSILLWALFAGIIGLVLSAKSKDYEPWVMAFWNTVQLFLFTLLLAKSPFARTQMGGMVSTPPDGQGLNPLLQNFWIAIHPPMLFVGYAAMAVPAAFVVAGLIKRDYNSWSNRCLPWTLFGWITLGAGLILGSYWAYEVLGWGGYWGWDPVENASLVPWIAATALLHGLLVERYRGSMRRTNIALALLSFLLVIYATYLTRSGVLGAFSQHSFTASETNAYLIGFMLFFTLLSVGLFAWRAREAESKSWYGSVVSKEFAFFIAILTFASLALLVLLGTSSPLISSAIGSTGVFLRSHLGHFGASNAVLRRLASLHPSAVGQSFYGLISAPASLIILLALALAPLLAWARRTEGESRSSNTWLIRVAALIAVSLVVGGVVAAVKGISLGVNVAVALIATVGLAVNAWAAWRYGIGSWKRLGTVLVLLLTLAVLVGVQIIVAAYLRSAFAANPGHPMGLESSFVVCVFSMIMAAEIALVRWASLREPRALGGYLAHAGIALMFIAMVFSPSIRKAPKVELPQGSQVKKLGYTFSFLGTANREQGGVAMRVKVSKAGKSFIADPVMRPTNDGMMYIPNIRKSLLQDLYISPVEVRTPEIVPVQIRTSAGTQFANAVTPDGETTLQLMGMQVESQTVILLVRQHGLQPAALSLVKGKSKPIGKYYLRFDGFDMRTPHDTAGGMEVGARIAVYYPGVGSTAVIEVSAKRLISLLWIGSILALLGGVIAIFRRVGENRKILTSSE